MVKACTKCGSTTNGFHLNRNARDGLAWACKECARAKAKKWRDDDPARCCAAARAFYAKHPERSRARMREWAYGLAPGRYEEMLSAQGGVCAICGEVELRERQDGSRRSLNTDHDHTCCPGKRSCGACVRGLLCANCNGMLGQARDDPERLQAAIDYLRRAS